MGDVGRLEAELEVARIQEEFEALRPKAKGKNPKDADVARFRELMDQLAAARTAFKEKYPAGAPAEGDASATPASVAAKTK